MKKKIKYFFLISFAWFAIHECLITIDGLTDDEEYTEAAVIFGTKVNEDGTLSKRLKARVDRGLKLYNDSLINMLVVSGGFGKEGHYEGTKMFEYLISQGVQPAHIHIDNNGNNTKLTAINLKKELPKLKSVTVVTQFFHISRAKLAMQKVGIKNVKGAHCNHYETKDAYSMFREFFAYYKYLVM